MPQLDDVEISCGIRQLHGLCRNLDVYRAEDKIAPKQVLLEAFDGDHDGGGIDWFSGYPERASEITFSIVLFSDSVRRGNGKRLAAYIEKSNLGKVVASDVTYNPNTKRDIQMWTWYLDREALVAWFKKNKPKEAKDAYNDYDRRVYPAARW